MLDRRFFWLGSMGDLELVGCTKWPTKNFEKKELLMQKKLGRTTPLSSRSFGSLLGGEAENEDDFPWSKITEAFQTISRKAETCNERAYSAC